MTRTTLAQTNHGGGGSARAAFFQDSPGHSQDNVKAYARAISRGGVAFAAAFLMPWWPLGDAGLHFVASLFAFDAGFTWVMLAQCGLFAELERSSGGRAELVAASQVAAWVGGGGIIGSTLLYNPANPWSFRVFTLLVAVTAAACFAYTGHVVGALAPPPASPDGGEGATTLCETEEGGGGARAAVAGVAPPPAGRGSGACTAASVRRLMGTAREIVCARNFVCFVRCVRACVLACVCVCWRAAAHFIMTGPVYGTIVL